jgi:hypothetical protein
MLIAVNTYPFRSPRQEITPPTVIVAPAYVPCNTRSDLISTVASAR